MLRPPIRVARPGDWSGRLAFFAVWLVFAIAVLVIMLVRLPAAWVEPLPHPVMLRAGLVLVVLLVVRVLAVLLYSRLRWAVFLSGNRIVFRDRGRRRSVPLDEIAEIHVDLRPPPVHEMFVLQTRDGSEHDLCPVHWAGAGRFYAATARRLRRRKR